MIFRPSLALALLLTGCSADPHAAEDAAGMGDAAVEPCDCDGGVSGAADAAIPDQPPPDAAVPVAELVVCASGGTYATISAAIGAAPAGSLIQICPGSYNESLVIDGKQLHLRGLGGADATVIDATGLGRALLVTSADVVIEGLTIRGGTTAAEGGGIRCDTSTLQLTASVVTGNQATGGGGGLYATGCALTISATTFDGNDGGEQRGGGALVIGGSGTIADSLFLANQAELGGGLALVEGTIAIVNNQFLSNLAGLQGGAIHLEASSLVEGNTLAGNDSGWTGGGLFVLGHAATVQGNTVSDNSAADDGGGIYAHQGTPTLYANVVTGNWCGDDGGGIRLFESDAHVEANHVEGNHADGDGGGIRVSHVASEFIDNVILDNDASGYGGGMDMDNDSSVVRGGLISGNNANRGGGIHATLFPWFDALIENVVITDNNANRGGGIALEDNFYPVAMRGLTLRGNTANRGAGLYVRATHFTLENSLFDANDGGVQGGGIYVGDPPSSPWSDPCPCPPVDPVGQIRFVVIHGSDADAGSAIWTNSPGLIVENSILHANSNTAVTVVGLEPTPEVTFPPQWRYNDTEPATFAGMADPTGGSGNVSVDPQFVDLAGDDFHLIGASACRNAGDPTLLDTDSTRADMGMFGGPMGSP